jgi:hypothetical protein
MGTPESKEVLSREGVAIPIPGRSRAADVAHGPMKMETTERVV